MEFLIKNETLHSRWNLEERKRGTEYFQKLTAKQSARLCSLLGVGLGLFPTDYISIV